MYRAHSFLVCLLAISTLVLSYSSDFAHVPTRDWTTRCDAVLDARRHRFLKRHLGEHASDLWQSVTLPEPASNSTCELSPELTEGPFYLAHQLIRDQITNGQPGAPLSLAVHLIDTADCEPINGAYIDLWHANALGVYSGVSDDRFGFLKVANLFMRILQALLRILVPGPLRPDVAHLVPTIYDDEHPDPGELNLFLRGVFPTGSDGTVFFSTILPGHYAGRAVHIHMKVILNADLLQQPDGQTMLGTNHTVQHTGQVFFTDELYDKFILQRPYSLNKARRTTNSQDHLFREASRHGHQSLVQVDETSEGLVGWITVGIDKAFVSSGRPSQIPITNEHTPLAH